MLENVEQFYISFPLLWKLFCKGFLSLSPVIIPNRETSNQQWLLVMFDDDDGEEEFVHPGQVILTLALRIL